METIQKVHATKDPALVRRVNELYHDFQSREFNELHKRRHRVERRFWERNALPELAALGASEGIDLCTGTGFIPTVLLPKLPEGTILACVDISANALNEARMALGDLSERARFCVGDATDIPRAASSVDWVTLNAGLHHIPDVKQVLKEVDRVLRPSGLFFLGHEPNRAFAESPFVYRVERSIWHAYWYLSPSRNIRRLKRVVGITVDGIGSHDHLGEMNEALLAEGMLESPLSISELQRMVDVHTHQDGNGKRKKGFDVSELLRDHFPDYTVLRIAYTDYGGQMLRKHAALRTLYDRVMSGIAPGKGALFSWIIQKPA
jgi:SAM-dependent methyltransferase